MGPDALREAFVGCVTAGRCGLCGRALDGEAVWRADRVWCVDCGRIHGEPGAPQAHAVWRPEAARLFLETAPPDVERGA